MVYQVNLVPNVVVHLGAVYALPSGRYVRVLNQTNLGWYCESVCVRSMQALANGNMDLTGYFLWYYGKVCWNAGQWQARIDQVAHEAEEVRKMRERHLIAASQDDARAKEIDKLYAGKRA